MSYDIDQLSEYYDALANRIQGIPTNEQIDALTNLINVQHQALLDLIDDITERLQSLEDWKIVHMQDTNYLNP